MILETLLLGREMFTVLAWWLGEERHAEDSAAKKVARGLLPKTMQKYVL